MNKRYVYGAICFSLMMLTLFACSGPSFPYGTYVTSSGSNKLVLHDDGTYMFSQSGRTISTGTFTIDGDKLTWETDSYCDKLSASPATYTWTYKDNTLVLAVDVSDQCSSRVRVLNRVPYQFEE